MAWQETKLYSCMHNWCVMFSQICRKGLSLRSEFGHNLRHWKNSLVWSKRIWSWYRKKQGGRQQIWTLDIRGEDEKAWRNRDLQNDFEGWLPDAKPIASPAMVNSNKWRLTPSELTWQIISWINSKGSFCIPLFTATLMDIYAIIKGGRARWVPKGCVLAHIYTASSLAFPMNLKIDVRNMWQMTL